MQLGLEVRRVALMSVSPERALPSGFHELGLSLRRRDGEAVFAQAFHMHGDGFADVLLDVFSSRTGRDAAWEVRHVSRIVARRFFDNHQVFHLCSPFQQNAGLIRIANQPWLQ